MASLSITLTWLSSDFNFLGLVVFMIFGQKFSFWDGLRSQHSVIAEFLGFALPCGREMNRIYEGL